jgi:hypothetical protein
MTLKMKKKNSLTLDSEFLLYCEINGIENIDKLAKETFERGFSLLKYGETPTGNTEIKEKIVEVIKEVIIEKQLPPEIQYIEKEVEVIKEVIVEKVVEVIKEVPIQIQGDTQIITKEIIKEVPVEKIVEVIKEVIVQVDNTDEIKKLTNKNSELEKELETIKQSLDKFNKATYMKNSDLGSLYSE